MAGTTTLFDWGEPLRHRQTHAGGPQAAEYAARGDSAAEADRPAGVRLRRAVLGGVRPGRDPADPQPGRVDRVRVLLEDRDPGRGGDAGGGRLVPAERPRLPLRGR